jgi:carboxyl-terminal processing protease
MKTSYRILVMLISLIGLLISCGDDNKNEHIEKVNAEILEMMEEVYLWNDYMPRNLDPGDYSSPADLMEALRYTQYDRWSTVLTEEEWNSYFEEGEMVGHGFMPGLDLTNKIRIAFVYPGTETAEKGVQRGWILTKVNGTNLTVDNFGSLMGENEVGVTNEITFTDENGQSVTLSLTKEIIELQPVLHHEVLEQGTDKIGYMVLQDFIDAANSEMDLVFTEFVNAGINELVIDMRYNGGGSSDVAQHMAGWLLGKDFGGEPFMYYQHNGILSSFLDTMYTVPNKTNGLSLDRIFFIGTHNTASASELIINGVKSFIGSVLAGSATHGKPVGMYAIPILDYVTLPVAFKYTNKDHEGDFYNGISPTLPASDDMTRNFGDPDEASLKAILDYIETGTTKTTKSTSFRSTYIERKEPIGQFLKAY